MFSGVLSSFSDLFSDPKTPAPTPAPPNMRIVPCSALDMWAQDRVLTLGLVVDTSLEPQALEWSLSMLVVRKFPRAGARLTERNWVCIRSLLYLTNIIQHF
jgi:hypothetical protein